MIAACLVISSGLTGCVHGSRAAAASHRLWQPPFLRLPAGAEVRTLDGVHRPAAPEIWHSDERFRACERQLIDALAALEAERSRRR